MDFEKPNRAELWLHVLVAHGLLSRAYRRYARQLGLAGHESVMDFGCGTGALSRHLAPLLLAGGGRLTCVDTSAALLAVARRSLRRFPNVEFRCGNLAELEVADGSFDAVVIHFMLHDVPAEARPETLAAVAGKLKPTGRLFVREPTRPGHGIRPEEIRRLAAGAGLTEQSHALGGGRLLGPQYSGVFARGD